MHVLLVDDDPDYRAMASMGLSGCGMKITQAASATQAWQVIQEAQPGDYDVILLDIDLPDGSGLELLERLREFGVETPLLLVSALEGLEKKVGGLDLGADDYVVKPIEVNELAARIRAVCRRAASLQPINYGDLRLDLAHRRAHLGGKEIELSPREYDLLLALVESKGEVVGRTELLKRVWKLDFDPGTNVLDVHIGRLRKKLHDPRQPLIETVRGEGYRAVKRDPVNPAQPST